MHRHRHPSAGALEFLQRHCLVHRDIKPSNVIYLDGKLVLADVGLLADTREAQSLVGTPGYVPREQHGRFAGDLYSLGILLLEISTGRPAAESGAAPVEEANTDAPSFSRWIDILSRVCDPNPARRYQTATALLRDLRALRDAPPPSHAVVNTKQVLLRRIEISAGIALLALAILLSFRRRAEPPSVPSPAVSASEEIPEELSIPSMMPWTPPIISLFGEEPSAPARATDGKRRIRLNIRTNDLPPDLTVAAEASRLLFAYPDADAMKNWRIIRLGFAPDTGAPQLDISPLQQIAPVSYPAASPLFRMPPINPDNPQPAVAEYAFPSTWLDEIEWLEAAQQAQQNLDFNSPDNLFVYLTESIPRTWESMVQDLQRKWNATPPANPMEACSEYHGACMEVFRITYLRQLGLQVP